MTRVQGCKGAKGCSRGALHPGDGVETKGAMHCTPNGVPVLLHPYVSLVPPSPMPRVAMGEHADCETFTTEHYAGARWLICVDCDVEVGPVPPCAAQPCRQYARILKGDDLCYGHRHYWGVN